MTYENYYPAGREVLLEKLADQVSAKRLRHMLAVEEAAISLAKRHGGDSEQAGLAGLLHDYAKEVPDQDFLILIEDKDLDSDLKKWGNNVWHGLLGVYKIQEDLGITDQAILQAISHHTVGSSQMTLLDKIVYVADYIEAGRDFPGVNKARKLAQQSLDKAVAYETAQTIAFLAKKALPIYPQTLETYNAYVHHLKED